MKIESVAEAHPLPILVSWEYKGVNIRNQTNVRIYHEENMPNQFTLQSVLSISNTTMLDSGLVTVKFHHPLGSIDATTFINVVGMYTVMSFKLI